jgi:hypothetical protein
MKAKKDALKEEKAKQEEKRLSKYVGQSGELVKLSSIIRNGSALEWHVRIRPRKGTSNVLLCTPQGNVKSNKDGVFGNKGGDGIWAQWEMNPLEDRVASFKHAGTGMYLAVTSFGKAYLEDTEVMFSISPVANQIDSSNKAYSLVSCTEGLVLPWEFKLQSKAGTPITFLSTPNGNICCNSNSVFGDKGGQGPWASWILFRENEEESDGIVTLKNQGHGTFLTLNMTEGKVVPTLSKTPTTFHLRKCNEPACVETQTSSETVSLPPVNESAPVETQTSSETILLPPVTSTSPVFEGIDVEYVQVLDSN